MKMRYRHSFLRSEEFEGYYRLMASPDNRTRIIGLQKLEQRLQKGKLLTPADGAKLESYLLKLFQEPGVGIEAFDAVRRCAYRLAARREAFVFRDVCLELLTTERNPDNKLSIIPILSGLPDSDRLIERAGLDAGLSLSQMKLAKYASPVYVGPEPEREFIYGLLDANDITALRFLPIISNAHSRSLRSNSAVLNPELFGVLAKHDDSWVQKFALGTFTNVDRFRIEQLNISPSDFLQLDSQPKKWVMTSMFLDRGFINGNEDLVRCVLSERHLREDCDNRVKEGIAQGLLYYGYNGKWADDICRWYSTERDPSVKALLRSYLMRTKYRNAEFQYVLRSEEEDGYGFDSDRGLFLPKEIEGGRLSSLWGIRNRTPKRDRKESNPGLAHTPDAQLADGSCHKEERLLEDLLDIGSLLCKNAEYHTDSSEDAFNNYISDMLCAKEWDAQREIMHGRSGNGRNGGHVDILVCWEHREIAIIEGLILDSVNKNYIDVHIRKATGNYNPFGTATFVISYCLAKDFGVFWEKYTAYVRGFQFDSHIIVDEQLSLLPVQCASSRAARLVLRKDGYRIPVYFIAFKIG